MMVSPNKALFKVSELLFSPDKWYFKHFVQNVHTIPLASDNETLFAGNFCIRGFPRYEFPLVVDLPTFEWEFQDPKMI